MVKILDRPSPGSVLGAALGSGLAGGLNRLIESKLSQLQRKQGLMSLVDPGQAESLSYVPDSMLSNIIPTLARESQRQSNLSMLSSIFQPDAAPGVGAPLGVDQSAALLQPPVDQGQQIQAAQVPGQAFKPGETAMRALSSGLDLGNALRLEQEAAKLAQTERLAKERKAERMEQEQFRSKEKVRLADLQSIRKDVQDINKGIQSKDDSIRANEDVLRLLDTGRVDTGLTYLFKDIAGLSKAGASPETQTVAKILAAEPIRSLATIPGQSARLSKVFDTISDMTPQLVNTEAGLRSIARVRIADSRASKIFDEAKLRELQRIRNSGELIPFDIDERVRKKVQPKLNKQYNEVERIIAGRIGSDNPEELPDNFEVGQKAIWPRNGLSYIVKIDNGKKVWAPFKPKKRVKE